MQISPIAAMEATLAHFVTSLASQQQLTVGPVAQPGNRMAGTIHEVNVATKKNKLQASEHAQPAAHQQEAQLAPAANSTEPNSPGKVEQTQPVIERQLFDYLVEMAKHRSGTQSDPSALWNSALQSVGGVMEQAQKALGDFLPAVTGEIEPGTQDTFAPAMPETSKASKAKLDHADLEKLFEQYLSVSWSVVGASLATNSVAAASSSVNTLIKQQ